MLKKKIAIIIPFFGDLNCKGYFQRFLDSCRDNSDVTWLFFTDDHKLYEWPENVKVTYTSFEEICNIIQSKFPFKINISAPYKLCDFKPAYGDIFCDYLRDYDWWGYGDTDLIWGKIDHFITDEMLSEYEQLYSRGHLTLSKNTEFMRSLYKDTGKVEFYKNIFSSNKHFAFDELHIEGGYREIVSRNNIKLYDSLDFADISKVNRFSLLSFELAQVQLKESEKNKKNSLFYHSGGGTIQDIL